jgi:hypothetical protein
MQLTDFNKTCPYSGMSTTVHVHMALTSSWGDRHA